MAPKTTMVVAAVVMAGAVGVGATYFVMSRGYDMMGHHSGGMMQHDEANMPGLQGENATPEESAELAVMFRSFKTITRDVENLPDGIRTVTRSSDPEVMNSLVSHVIGMIDRVDELDDPKIGIQSPTLDIFFIRGQGITSDIDVTDDGIVVIQTSQDADVVTALHEHAAEVTAMADRGMQAVHEMMMGNGESH
ncbi:hypothetical protein N9632_00830 [bacterium]|nr:hypothetical protein [bacterium]